MTSVIVIGAGLSGLTCARHLVREGYHVVILEARTRLGGRADTRSGSGLHAPLDFGCSMMHGYDENTPVRILAEECGVSSWKIPKALPAVYASAGPIGDSEAQSLFESAQLKVDNAQVDASTSLAKTGLAGLGEQAQAIARLGEIGAGLPLEQLSAKYHGFARGFGGTDAFPQPGFTMLVAMLADDVQKQGTQIKTGEEVSAMRKDGQQVHVDTSTGASYSADYVVCTIPLGVLKDHPPSFKPALALEFEKAKERVQVGVLDKVYLSYDAAWWPDASTRSGHILLPVTKDRKTQTLEATLPSMTLNVTNFAALGPRTHNTLLVYLHSDAGRAASALSPEEVGQTVHDYLAKRLGPSSSSSSADVPKPTAVNVSNWLADPYARGATSAPVSTATSSDGQTNSPLDYVVLGRSQWDERLGFAGEHTELDTRGSVAGAVISGEREARRLIRVIKSRASVVAAASGNGKL